MSADPRYCMESLPPVLVTIIRRRDTSWAQAQIWMQLPQEKMYLIAEKNVSYSYFWGRTGQRLESWLS